MFFRIQFNPPSRSTHYQTKLTITIYYFPITSYLYLPGANRLYRTNYNNTTMSNNPTPLQ
jgi:hypothetical protein